jgi:PilZ domain
MEEHPMELRLWIAGFKALHERARKGSLSGEERKQYLDLRDELAKAMCSAQRLETLPGQTPRQTMRVARGLQVDLELAEGRQRLMTMNISIGGFAALMPKDLNPKTPPIGFAMRLPGSSEPLIGRVRVASSQKRPGNALVSFAFTELGASDQERLELALFDSVLQQFDSTQF